MSRPTLNDGLCVGTKVDLWSGDERWSAVRAKAVCHVCPVEQLCLDTALANEEPFGIWGGMNAEERTREARRRRGSR